MHLHWSFTLDAIEYRTSQRPEQPELPSRSSCNQALRRIVLGHISILDFYISDALVVDPVRASAPGLVDYVVDEVLYQPVGQGRPQVVYDLAEVVRLDVPRTYKSE